ncbi:hypothetical protein DASC09_029030 [Saccharomycopsis crataegensis]|uniref:Fe2OG dioxygenase domain-containing protein n=1 Tax=Saccharomycopsis crataegensis TaxID=43959 RepID=A0AAV5QN48_9ASCO|nr:hypothetical protein DASC09_029030 [Saccharomycopsis crataegensis]
MLSEEYFDPEKRATVDQLHNVRPFIEAPPTKEPVDFMDLDTIDLSTFQDGPQGLSSRQKLAQQLESVLTDYGFFKLVGHGISEATFERMKSIGQAIFELEDDIKNQFVGGEKKIPQEEERDLGVIRGTGFKPRGYLEYTNGQRDNVEFYNLRHFQHDDIFYNKTEYPEFVKYHLDEISEYFKHLHFETLRKLLILMDIILELPEGQLWENHFKVIENDINRSGGGRARFLMYHEVEKEYVKKTNGTWLRGHSDACAITFILSQPIVSLQVREHDSNNWKYISHTSNSLVVNIGDAFKFLTGGYFKSSLHRVTTPPGDQLKHKRNTVIYFSNPSLTTYIDPLSLNSPKLDRLGYGIEPGVERITFKQWDEAKGTYFNQKNQQNSKEVSLLGRSTLMSYIDGAPSEKKALSVS